MKKIAAVMLVVFSGLAQAELIDRGGGFIYDTVQDITWTQNANINGVGTWETQVEWANSLAIYDSVRDVTWDDWRLPTTLQPDPSCSLQVNYGDEYPLMPAGMGFDCTGSEMGHLANVDGIRHGSPGLFTNVGQDTLYWSDTELVLDVPIGRWNMSFGTGMQMVSEQISTELNAWAVRDGDVTSFRDAPTSHWAFSFIETLADSGITAGCGNGNYCPLSPVTRAQMAVFLERGMNGSDYSPPAATGNVFLDVAVNSFAASFIEQLASDGITSGCGNNNYCPDANVTRAQMAVFLLRAKHGSSYSPPSATAIFNDVPLSHWAVHWIEQLAAEGITSGCGNDNYCPDAVVTRDQMAVFLVRAFDL